MKKITLLALQLLAPIIVFSQSLSSVSPASATNGQTLSVTITGSGTHFTQGSNTVYFQFDQMSATAAYSIGVVDDVTINAKLAVPSNQHTGDYNISVYNSVYGSVSLNAGFHINGITPATISSVSPANATNGQTLDVTITGANTHFNQGTSTSIGFSFKQASGTATVNSTTVLSDTQISANITVPSTTYTGNYDVSISNGIDGHVTSYGSFHVNGVTPPSLVSISPATATNGQTLDVTITGSGTHFIQASGTSLSFSFKSGSSTINSMTMVSDVSIQANITVPANVVTGDYDVSVYNPVDGYQYLYNAFHVNGVPPPSLVSISPATATAGQTLDVSITGANTNFIQGSGTSINFSFIQGSGTIIVNSKTAVSNTVMNANITVVQSSATSDYNMNLSNNVDGFIYLSNAFHVNAFVPAPIVPGTLVSINPAGAKASQTVNVTITGTGTHFSQGSSTSVSFDFKQSNVTAATSTKIINDSTVSAVIVIPANVAVGKYSAIVSSSLDKQLSYDFYVYENCFSHFTTTYNDSNSKFTLKLDSVTSTPGSSFAWDFGDGGTSTDETPVHVFATDAIYNVCLNVTLASGETCSYCHEIGKDANGKVVRNAGFTLETVRYDGTVSISESNASSSLIAVYPNPANDAVTITASNAEALHNATLSLLSIEGQLLIQQPLKQCKTELSIGSLAKGTYVIKIVSNEKTEVIKLVKE